ncbi:MAG: hypothetical protein ACK58M_28570 [Acidobacteriota bacterium]
MSRFLVWVLLVVALLPSMWMAAAAWELPQLGTREEDGTYYNAAMALGEGRGYRATSVPGEPMLTRFPPGFPALLAPFVQSRMLLSLLLWLLAPCALALVYFWGRQQRFDSLTAALVCLPLGAFPLFVQGGANLAPDLLALVLVLVTVYVMEQDSWAATLLGALAGAASYLTSDTLLPGLGGVVVYVVLRRRYGQAAVYAVALLATALAWRVYVELNAAGTVSPLRDWYAGRPPGFGLEYAAFDVRTGLLVAVWAAVWRTGSRQELSALGCFAAAHAVAVQFSPGHFFLLTLGPALIAGLATLPLDRILLGTAYLAGLTALPAMVGEVQRHRAMYPIRNQAYFWIEGKTPPAALFLATNGALLHAATWRRAVSPRDLPDPTGLALDAGIDYLLVMPFDPAAYRTAVREDPFYETVYEHDGVLIRRRRS